jgi:hypothetical protein
MINRILQKMNGTSADPAALAAALADLDQQRAATRDKIDELGKRRHQALLDDADDATLDKIERQIDRETIRLEKINLAEAPLRERLGAARAEQRRAQLAEFKGEIGQVGRVLVDAARVLVSAANAYVLLGDRMRGAGFEKEMGAHYINAPMLNGAFLASHELIEIFAGELMRVTAAPKPKKRPAAKTTQPEKVASKPAPGGNQSMVGDRVTVPASTARSLMENGAADFAQDQTGATEGA